jgi:UDP-2,4-diacetamido-2,4,6-trideoxy-beta-L-altropyranose hydrolase
MRCLTLAEKLQDEGATVSFVCREFPGNLCAQIRGRGYQVTVLPGGDPVFGEGEGEDNYAAWLGVSQGEDAAQTGAVLRELGSACDWLIVDHYGIDAEWHRAIRPLVKRIMVIDDLANRNYQCDMLLDQNLYPDPEGRYASLVEPGTRLLLGPRYALLREEFVEAGRNQRLRDGKVKRILVFFGGCDPSNETAKALSALKLLGSDRFRVDVVVGTANPHRESIQQICSNLPNVFFHCQVNNMAELMTAADLAIGGGGTTTWERCCLGLPTLTVIVADNQMPTTIDLANAGIIRNLGLSHEVDAARIVEAVKELIKDPRRLIKMSGAAMKLGVGESVDAIKAFLFDTVSTLSANEDVKAKS